MRHASGHNYRNSSFIVDVAMGQIPRSTERISSLCLILTDNLSRTVSKLLQTIIQILDEKRPLYVFEPPLGGSGRGNVRCSHRLIGKLVVDFLFVLIELFSLGVMAEALRTNGEPPLTIARSNDRR